MCVCHLHIDFSSNVNCVLPRSEKELHEANEYAKLMQCANEHIIKQKDQGPHRVSEQHKS